MSDIKSQLLMIASPKGRRAFLGRLKDRARLLDVGCGNNSPYRAKRQRPDLYYIGLDIADYHQTKPVLADDYLLSSPEEFPVAIEGLAGTMDAVMSSHNIEHCLDPSRVVRAMGNALKPGGTLYMSFPSEASVNFPSRGGCLNFFDDPTHHALPQYDGILRCLQDAGCTILVAERRYKPLVSRLIGGVLEPVSRVRRHTMFGTWAFYGFESVLWAQRK
jgi:SAM-dependent methyltransferase